MTSSSFITMSKITIFADHEKKPRLVNKHSLRASACFRTLSSPYRNATENVSNLQKITPDVWAAYRVFSPLEKESC